MKFEIKCVSKSTCSANCILDMRVLEEGDFISNFLLMSLSSCCFMALLSVKRHCLKSCPFHM